MASTRLSSVEGVLGAFLLSYQVAWLRDTSRKKIALKSRQIGFTEAIVWEMLLEAMSNPRRRIYVISTNLKNAKEVLARIVDRVDILRSAGIRVGLVQALKESLTFHNGARIIVLPCKAASVRGISGSLYLDEFAFYVADREIWEAIFPAVSRGTGDQALRVRIVSTPWGLANEYHRLWDVGRGWSRHRVDIHEAVRAGHPVDVEQLRAEYTTDAFRQEFECSFDAGSGMYFSPALLRSRCLGRPVREEGRLILGIDLASVADNTSVVRLWERTSPKGRTVVELGRVDAVQGMSYPDQEDWISDIIEQESPDKVVLDATGGGLGLTQYLARTYPELVDGQTMSQPWQVRTVERLKLRLEQGAFALHQEPELFRDFAQVEQATTPKNRRTYKIKRTKTGHGDRFWGLALAFSRSGAYLDAKKTPLGHEVEIPQHASLGSDFGYLDAF